MSNKKAHEFKENLEKCYKIVQQSSVKGISEVGGLVGYNTNNGIINNSVVYIITVYTIIMSSTRYVLGIWVCISSIVYCDEVYDIGTTSVVE